MTMKKRSRSDHDSTIVDVWKRELGQLSSRNFANRLAASEDLVLRLDILRKLDVHRGCVNTVSFNASGDTLVSGSDDKRIVLWDWESGQVKFSFHSDHSNNVFQAKFMPYTEDKRIVTCAADGQVRFAQISECRVETKLLAEHQGRVHKLAIEPGSPYNLYTVGEDGVVQHIDMRTEIATGLFTCKPVPSHNFFHAVHLNAITIDPRNPNLFALGGLDPFARLYDIRRYKWDGSSEYGQPVDFFCPMHLTDDENVGITGLAFSDQSELLVSYNDEFIYLFTKDLGLGPNPTFSSQVSRGSDAGDTTFDIFSGSSLPNVDGDLKAAPHSYKGHRNSETVKGVGFFGPKCEYVVSGSDCGRIFIWNKKGGELVRVMEADKHVVNCVVPHPHSTVLASSGIEHDIKMWTPKAIDRAILPTNIQKDRVVSLIRQRFTFFPFGGFYDDGDDDDFICLDENDDNDDDGDEDDNESDSSHSTIGGSNDDDDDDDEEEEEDGNCDNKDYITENYDDHRGNEVSPEQLEEDNNDGTDFTSVGDSDDKNDSGSDTSLYNEMDDSSESENAVDTGNAASDDSFLDTCDIGNYSDFECSDSDFDD